MQRGTDPECRFFQYFADQGHYQEPGTSRQGIYAVAPSGKLLGSVNNLDPKVVRELLVDAIKQWDRIEEEEKHMPPESELAPTHRWEHSYPENGLTLRSYSRDLPADGNVSAEPSLRWNRDHTWFTAEELRMWLPEDPKPGAVHSVPQLLVDRLTRFHIVDHVNGQTLPFHSSEVADSKLTITITQVDGPTVSFEVHGETIGNTDGTWRMDPATEFANLAPTRKRPHGLRTRVWGDGTFDAETRAFTRFDMVALGVRWGGTRFNGRRRRANDSPIGFAFELAPDTPAGKIAPAFAGSEYATWVKLPDKKSP